MTHGWAPRVRGVSVVGGRPQGPLQRLLHDREARMRLFQRREGRRVALPLHGCRPPLPLQEARAPDRRAAHPLHGRPGTPEERLRSGPHGRGFRLVDKGGVPGVPPGVSGRQGHPDTTPWRSAASSSASGRSRTRSRADASWCSSTTRRPSAPSRGVGPPSWTSTSSSSTPGSSALTTRLSPSSCGSPQLNLFDVPSRGAPPLSGEWVPPVMKWLFLAASFPGKEGSHRLTSNSAQTPFSPFFQMSSPRCTSTSRYG